MSPPIAFFREFEYNQLMRFIALLSCGWLASCLVLQFAAADDVDDQLKVIARTGPQGAGSFDARQARDHLAKQGVEILPRLLVAMDTPNLIAANWYRTVYEQIVARELSKPSPQFPLPLLKDYVQNPKRQGNVRRLVLALLDRLEPQFGPALLPALLDDPEFRTEAVAVVLKSGDAALAAGKREAARETYRRAFEHSRQADQVVAAAGKLKSVGEDVSVAGHLGIVVDWHLLGPFDAPGMSGFSRVFPPEENVDLKAAYDGQAGEKIAWKPYHTPDPLGQLDLNQALAATREAAGYAYAEVVSPREHAAQLRCGADDNCTVWLNGKKVFAREQWLNGTRFDRFVAPVNLLAGRNRVLVKICQGPQHVDPAVPNNWSLQLRFCDADGAGVIGLAP